jgi:putative ABC transport system permease protein
VVTQFAASAGLILGTFVIYQQLDYVQTKHLGFDEEQVVTVDLQDVPESRHALLRRKARQHPDVVQATVGSAAPGGFGITFTNEPEDLSPDAQTSREEIQVHPAKVDTSYVETLGLRLVAGRDFDAAPASGATQGYLLNEAAAEAFGWTPEAAVGKRFTLAQADDDPMGQVIGVVENFHLESLRSQITPVVLVQEAEDFSSPGVLAARLAPDGISGAMDHLQSVIREVAPSMSFEYTFLDEKFAQMYRAEQRLARIFAAFALIAVVVACMGLFALAAFSVRRRTKEIGVRKALGATATSIVGLLSKEYATLLAAGLAVGTPVAYLGMHRWLQAFAYRVDVGMAPFVWTAVLAMGVAGLSVSVHALRAAHTDPAAALRDE